MPLPPFTPMPVPSNGTMVPKVIVIHRAENALGDGRGLANYSYNNPGRYRWHWSVGGGGQAFRHLTFIEEGVHAAGLNSFAVGIEQDGFSASSPWPEAQLRTTAAIVAEFCRFIGKAPSRDFIIGHGEDNLTTRAKTPGTFTAWGGSSTHTDPEPNFPWPKFMDYVQEAYDGEEENDVGKITDPTQQAQLEFAFLFDRGVSVGMGIGTAPTNPKTLNSEAYKAGLATGTKLKALA